MIREVILKKITLDVISTNSIEYKLLRSLSRYSELLELKAPQIMIDNEKSLFQKYLTEAFVEDVIFVTLNFRSFYEQYKKQNALDSTRFTQEFQHYLTKLN